MKKIKGTILELPIRLKKNGFIYTLVKRNKSYCIYRQQITEAIFKYEVFKRRYRGSRVVGNVVLPGKEIFPNKEAFGYWAWSSWPLENAYKKYDQLNQKESLKRRKSA